MKKCFLFILVAAFSSSAFAQKIKVRKVRGNQAIVEFSGGTLNNGQVYELAGDDFGGPSFSGSAARNYVVTGSASITSLKSDASGSSSDSTFSFSGRFGWNLGTLEAGPMLVYKSVSIGSSTTNTMTFGAFGDYNMIANTPGEIFVYGAGGFGTFGQIDGGATKSDTMELFVGPFVKWFPGGNNVSLRFDLGYSYQKTSGGSGTDYTYTGFGGLGGIQAYF